MPIYDYVNDYTRDAETGMIVHRYSILTTTFVVHEVLESLAASHTGFGHDHSTICTIPAGQPDAGAWYGAYLSKEPPKEIDVLPRGDERSKRYEQWRAQRIAEARAMLLRNFPYLEGFESDFMGRIECTLSDTIRYSTP